MHGNAFRRRLSLLKWRLALGLSPQKDLRALRKMLFCNPADATHDVTLAFMNSRSPAFSYALLELLFSMPSDTLARTRLGAVFALDEGASLHENLLRCKAVFYRCFSLKAISPFLGAGAHDFITEDPLGARTCMNNLLDVHGASVWEWMITNCGTGAEVETLSHVQAQKLERQAKEGMAESQYLWGLVLWYGWGVPEDKGESNGWMMKAAEAGHPLAELTMGVNHLCGHASPRSEETAQPWLKRAAAHGSRLAAKMLEDLRG